MSVRSGSEYWLAHDVARLSAERARRERAALDALKAWRKEGVQGDREFSFRIEPLIEAADALIDFEARYWNAE